MNPHKNRYPGRRIVSAIFLAITTIAAHGQEPIVTSRIIDWPPNIIVPPVRVLPIEIPQAVDLTKVDVQINIRDQVARTTLDLHLRNPHNRVLEAELVLPVPDGAAVHGLDFEGDAAEPTARILPKEEARRIYNQIVAKVRDPALLEFVGYNLLRTSVFPVPANGTQRLRVTYEHLLKRDGPRVDYHLPRSDSPEYRVPWDINVDIEGRGPISTTYSPSHELVVERIAENRIKLRASEYAKTSPGAFRLSYLLQENGLSASLFAYPDPKVGGGYFLLLAGLPAADASKRESIKREVTLVFDRSGSMHGEKIDQVREAALQILGGLGDDEAFNLMVYNSAVDRFRDQPVLKTQDAEKAAREYLNSVLSRGGTNIHDALVEALRQEPADGMLPIVLFLTDGLPTIGQTAETVIRDVALNGNPYNRRVFTFGVGPDVNTPLLEKIAWESRGTPTFVLPGEDVELKVAQVFDRLAGPVLAGPTLATLEKAGAGTDPSRARDVMPAKLPDLFEGDQLVVLGQYTGEDDLRFRLNGNYFGDSKEFEYQFDLDSATTQNAFVARLWASRKIGMLIDAIREMGGNPTTAQHTLDPRIKELVEEVVRLSTEFGILTEYTAFLARQGTRLEDLELLRRVAVGNLSERAMKVRSGISSVNQDTNLVNMKTQVQLNFSNDYFDGEMKEVSVLDCAQVHDRAYFKKGDRWIDSNLIGTSETPTPDRTIEFGSEAYFDLAYQLADQHRQGSIARSGDILLEFEGETILVSGPK
jgi:Ca-activated chloride channel family protein